jgi:hypothetical protein
MPGIEASFKKLCYLGVALGLLIVFVRTRVPHLPQFDQTAASPPASAPDLARKVYPFSVIAGGAYDSEELSRARRVDSVVAAHYASFGSSPVVRRLSGDMLMYVSYRKSNQIFWTKTKRRIPKGESLLCGGDNFARTRCGNRLSSKPQLPVSEGKEPDEEALNTLAPPNAPLLGLGKPSELPEADFYVPGLSQPSDTSPVQSINTPTLPAQAAGPGVPSGAVYSAGFGQPGMPSFGSGGYFAARSGGSSSGLGGGGSAETEGTNPISATNTVIPEPSAVRLLILSFALSGIGVVRRLRGSLSSRIGG